MKRKHFLLIEPFEKCILLSDLIMETRESAVGIATGCGLDDRGVGV
jgi:hypothetical protein